MSLYVTFFDNYSWSMHPYREVVAKWGKNFKTDLSLGKEYGLKSTKTIYRCIVLGMTVFFGIK